MRGLIINVFYVKLHLSLLLVWLAMTFPDITIQSAIPMSLGDIKRACGARSYQRGMTYYHEGRVTDLTYEAEADEIGRLGATVSGSDDYEVTVYICYRGERELDGYCDCPMDYNCKHVAAACIAFLKEYASKQHKVPASKNALASDISQWLNRLEATANIAPRVLEDPYYPVYILRPIKGYWGSTDKYDVEIRLTRPRKNGQGLIKGQVASARRMAWGGQREFNNTRIEEKDIDVTSLLSATEGNYYYGSGTFSGRTGFHLLERLLDTGRCYWLDHENQALQLGPKQDLQVEWQQQKNSYQLVVKPDVIIFSTEPPMYLDTKQHQIGEIDIGQWTLEQIKILKAAPPVPNEQAERLAHVLEEQYPKLPIAQPVSLETEEQRHPLTPRLTMVKQKSGDDHYHCIQLMFAYGDVATFPLPVRAYHLETHNQKRIKVIRDHDAEEMALNRLVDLGFDLQSPQQENAPLILLPFAESKAASAAVWDEFIEQHKPRLESDGWLITVDDSFQLQFHDSDWSAELEYDEEQSDWFTLRFDLEVEGRPSLPLAPLLAPLLAEEGDLPEIVVLPMPGQADHYVRLPSQRLQPFLATLKELFDRATNDELKLSRYDALELDELSEHIDGAKALRELAAKLKNFNGIPVVAPPQGLQAKLREYQQQGLNWLQFLREYQLNGILADDMGLGKTVQTLAHLLLEKECGRLTSPVLIIAPTSLMGNWRREAQSFAPELKICVLHGSDRHQYYDMLDQFDLVLITYGLVVRDSEYLEAISFHTIVLDEAQVIKNPSAKMSKQVRRLKSQHRLCLSGTPMENHLGELWSLFDFLMPGFLGGRKEFTEYYRTPIEKHGDSERNQSLQRRVRPFMLRRTKNEVATELPPKTVIDQRVVLGKAQAELYESIRVSMDKQVREALAQKGLARSHITILDALLKLRQVCCDPRLVKLKGAKKVKDSAKLTLFLELLDELLSEGRKVLVFSQFTTMLGLIENAIIEREIIYTKLTGQTRKRDEAIERFRSGDANVFLISLKAGGTGLNLVEADTVIIYDPWWNPAVENQAIDRSHRIGQQKPVFVYRLIAENSVEEKITVLQAQKQALAEGVYSEDTNPEKGLLDADSLQALFAPIGS